MRHITDSLVPSPHSISTSCDNHFSRMSPQCFWFLSVVVLISQICVSILGSMFVAKRKDVCFSVCAWETTRTERAFMSLHRVRLLRVCAHTHATIHKWYTSVNDLVLTVRFWALHVCQVCCGGEDGVMSTNSNNNSSYAGCLLSLSYVVIRSGWKCGTTVPLTVTQRFSQAEDYRQKLAGLLSPLRATCHHSSGHWSRSSPLPLAIEVCAPDVCYGHLKPLKWLTLCVYMHASECEFVCSDSHYPSVCAASHWLGTILIVTCGSPQTASSLEGLTK